MASRFKLGDVVVLLPGILGSVLQRDGKEIWAPTPRSAVRALWTLGRSVGDLRLTVDTPEADDLSDGVVATRLVPDVHLIPGLWGIDGYSSIAASITGTFDVIPGRTFLELPYDWRRDNRVAARRLAALALPALHEQRKENPEAKLVLIGHSMGGLVARYFLECLDGWRDTRMLITFGTPYRGSLNALGFLANGFSKKVGPLALADLSALLRSLTSIYQLLPIYPCIDDGTNKLKRVAEASSLPVGINKARAYEAEYQFHRAIQSAVDARIDEHPYFIHSVVGLTQPTLQAARLDDNRLEMLRTYQGADLDGDGTVPRISATPIEYDGFRPDPTIYLPERHASLQNAVSVQTQLRGLLAPVEQPERFRDVRSGLQLDLDDLYRVGEEIPLIVTAGVRRASLAVSVLDLHTKRPVAGPLRLLPGDDQMLHVLTLPPLPAGCYQLKVAPTGESAGRVHPVHGTFLVADDTEPE